jgi:hypothetical protein
MIMIHKCDLVQVSWYVNAEVDSACQIFLKKAQELHWTHGWIFILAAVVAVAAT